MYTIFGLYASAIGITIVFVTLVAIVLVIEVIKRKFIKKEILHIKTRSSKLKIIAATAAVFASMNVIPTPRRSVLDVEVKSNWEAVARMESLRILEEMER